MSSGLKGVITSSPGSRQRVVRSQQLGPVVAANSVCPAIAYPRVLRPQHAGLEKNLYAPRLQLLAHMPKYRLWMCNQPLVDHRNGRQSTGQNPPHERCPHPLNAHARPRPRPRPRPGPFFIFVHLKAPGLLLVLFCEVWHHPGPRCTICRTLEGSPFGAGAGEHQNVMEEVRLCRDSIDRGNTWDQSRAFRGEGYRFQLPQRAQFC